MKTIQEKILDYPIVPPRFHPSLPYEIHVRRTVALYRIARKTLEIPDRPESATEVPEGRNGLILEPFQQTFNEDLRLLAILLLP